MLRMVPLGVLVLCACATTARPGVGLYSLTPEVIRDTGAHDLLRAVEQLRPRWLRECVTVFRNNTEFGSWESLREIGPDEVSRVVYIPKGHPRPGAGSAALNTRCPAIQVTTRE